jgi:hypothetical protein
MLGRQRVKVWIPYHYIDNKRRHLLGDLANIKNIQGRRKIG